MTQHRPANVDKAATLQRMFSAIVAGTHGLPVLFPVHPRTAKTLADLADLPTAIKLVEPQPYLEFNYLVKHAKAVFSGQPRDGGATILVQRFTAQQLLERKFAFFQQQNAFQRLTEPAFTMASDLACIIEDGLIKFKSQQKLRAIINLVEIYRAATDSEVETFATHPNLHIDDVEAFVAKTNQTSRKLIHAVLEDGVLDHYRPTVIQQCASATGLDVALQAGKSPCLMTRQASKRCCSS